MPTLIYSVIVVVVMVGAVLIGERVHRRRTVGGEEERVGYSLDMLAGATLTLAVITCSFMLAVTFSSYDGSARHAANEAGAVAGLYAAGSLLPDRAAAQQLQQDTICYARAVVADEWPRMRDGDFSGSALVDQWRQAMRSHIRATDATGTSAGSLSAVRDAEVTRTQTRQIRLVTAETHAPTYLYLLMLVVCAISMFVVTAFAVRGVLSALRLPIVAVLTVLLSATLIVIDDLDYSFTGLSSIGPDYIADVGANGAANYQLIWDKPVAACDDAGRPTP